MNQSATRAARLVYIRDLLYQQPRSVMELARLCEVSRDTIYRDLIDIQLEPLSVPLIVEDGRWRVLDRNELSNPD